MFLITADATSLCWGTRYEEDIGQERSCEVVVESNLCATYQRCQRTQNAPVQTGPSAHTASYTTGAGSFPGVKRPERGADRPRPSATEVKETEWGCTFSPLIGLNGRF